MGGRGGVDTKGKTNTKTFHVFDRGYEHSINKLNEVSNSKTWDTSLSDSEYNAVKYYTGSGYNSINGALYSTPFNQMSESKQETVQNLEAAINKFELYEGITVTRASDFKLFGAGNGETMTMAQIKDVLAQNNNKLVLNGFLSTGANMNGAEIDGSGLVVHYKVPPSIGAGAYVNPISSHKGSWENEFLFNWKSVMKYDPNSMYEDKHGNIHITAVWMGQAKKQSFKKL